MNMVITIMQRNMELKLQIFQSVLVKNYLAGQIKMEHVGRFVLYP